MTTAADNAPPLDLSSLMRLKEVEFRCRGSNVRWITVALQTAESINLERIVIDTLERSIAESAYREWQELDRLLLQFWTSRSIRPMIKHRWEGEERDLREFVSRLLPELASRGIVDLFDYW
jgi:hypothetical protein